MFPLIYYVVSLGLLLILLSQCRPNGLPGTGRPDVRFGASLLLLLTVMRLPGIFFNQELNADESQTLAGVITLMHDPVFGRSVDGTTLGPLNHYVLLGACALGLPPDYTTARGVGLLLIGASLLVFYRSLLRFASPVVARLTAVSTTLFFGLATHRDFIHYSSEVSSLLILTVCFDQAVRQLQAPRPAGSALFGLGVVAGLTPYCKLQTLALIGAVLGTLSVYLLATYRQRGVGPVAWLTAGFVLPTAVVFGVAAGFDIIPYYTRFYFVGNVATYAAIYADVPLATGSFVAKLLHFPLFFGHYTNFLLFVAVNGAVAVAGAVLAALRARLPLSFSWLMALVVLTATAALWSVITPGTEFGHHLLLLVFPLGWLTGLSVQCMAQRTAPATATRRTNWVRIATIVLMAEAGLVVLAAPYARHLLRQHRGQADDLFDAELANHPYGWLVNDNPPLYLFPRKARLVPSPVARAAQRYAGRSDRLVVWGWACRLYVESQLPQGVSEAQSQRCIVPNPMQTDYLSRYVRELRRNRPVLFLDAVGPTSLFFTKPQQRHEHFGGLARAVADQYALVDSVDAVRIYVRRDRLSSRGLSPASATISSL